MSARRIRRPDLSVSKATQKRDYYERALLRHHLDEPGLVVECNSLREIIERAELELADAHAYEVEQALNAAERVCGVLS
jgi:hypothetical protein